MDCKQATTSSCIVALQLTLSFTYQLHKIWIMERKRSSGIRRIFKVDFVGYFRLGYINVNDSPAGLG